MFFGFGRLRGAVAVLVAMAMLSGCAAPPGEGLTDSGEARSVDFPPLSSATRPDGIFPDRIVLHQIEPGVRKSHLLQWFGPPHFNEGIAGVREWDYIFHFYSGGGITTCRYKVIFDSAYVARRFDWRPDACGQWLSPSLSRQRPVDTAR
jgi:outer membrane protein assembly factor BamE (lipoprotein component of BamABCDE complex)